MYVIPCNYGQESIALIQWMYEQGCRDVHCVYVDTGWAAQGWLDRVEKLESWVEELGFSTKILHPKKDFVELMKAQKKFPTQKFQWCASFLKGLPLLDYLDFDRDPEMKSTIVLALRRSAARTLMTLSQRVESSEHYNGRSLWHPLWDKTAEEIEGLVHRSNVLSRFSLSLGGRSLECHPCVNSSASEVAACRSDGDIGPKIQALESLLGESFPSSSESSLQYSSSSLELFMKGCGLPFGCGL